MSIRQALLDADLDVIAIHCRQSAAQVVRSCCAWKDELGRANPDPDWSQWAFVAARVCECLRIQGDCKAALELARVGGGITRRLRLELALANVGTGQLQAGCTQLAAEPADSQRFAPLIAALSGASVNLSSPPKNEALKRLVAAAKTLRELAARKWTSARRAAAETGSTWFVELAECSQRLAVARPRRLDALLERLSDLSGGPEDARQAKLGAGREGAPPSGRQDASFSITDVLCCALIEDGLRSDPLLEVDVVSLRQAVSKSVFRHWFARKFHALASDRPALTRWLRGVQPEQLPRTQHAELYLQRAFSQAGAASAAARANLSTAKQLGADPIEVARAALLIERASDEPVFALVRVADELAALLHGAGGETEAAVVSASMWGMAGPDSCKGAPKEWLTERLQQSRRASSKLLQDEARANYELDCFEASVVVASEPERARQLAERATRALPELTLAWWALVACIGRLGGDGPAIEAVLAQALAATGSEEFRMKAAASSKGEAATFESLDWKFATGSDLIQAARAHQASIRSPDTGIARWYSTWAKVLPHRAEVDVSALAAFDAGVVAYALGAHPDVECAWLLGQMCGAGPMGTPTAGALWILFAPESKLGPTRATQLCALAVQRFVAPPGLAPECHPLTVFVGALVTYGMRPEAQQLLSRAAASVEMSTLRAAKKALDSTTPNLLVRRWDLLHDALHPAACLDDLLAGDLTEHSDEPFDFDDGFEPGNASALSNALGEPNVGGGGPKHEDLIVEFLQDIEDSAKLLRIDPEKFRALPPDEQIMFIDAYDAIEPEDSDAVARVRRIASEFGVSRTAEAPKLSLPKSSKDKNRRKRERRGLKGKK